MAADVVMQDSASIVTNLTDLKIGEYFCEYGCVPAEGTAVMTVWNGIAAVLTQNGIVVGYLMAHYNAVVRNRPMQGVVVASRNGADPLVTVRLSPV